MVDVNVNFILGDDDPVNADFQLEPDVTYTAEIITSSLSGEHPELRGRDEPDQHPISAITGLESALDGLSDDIIAENSRAIEAEEALDDKIDSEIDTRAEEITRVERLISDEETRAKGVEQGLRNGLTSEISRATNSESVLQTNITAEENRAKGVEQQLSSSIDSNHQAISSHVSDKNNPHQVTKAQVGLGNVENLAPADMPLSTATKTYVDNADSGLQGQITTINTTIGGYGNIVTHNVNEFATAAQGALADSALQPNDNISELTNNLNYQTSTQVANSIAVETSNRESADINLQSQIDAIVSASDVFDIVGTYAELQAYDISIVPVNDIIKVLVDSTHSGAATYYRCVETGGVKSWSYIGSEGAYYTKAEADSNFVPQTRTVNSKALSSDITLTASDVGALPSSTVIPTVNDSTVTVQTNGSTVSTFTLNQSSNETINITVPTKTSDITNDSGYITSASLPTVNNGQLDIQVNGSSVATFTANQSGNTTANIVVPDSATWGNITGDIADQTDLQDALDEKQDILSGGRYIEIVSGGTIATLPAGCKQVEYITATGTQHLDTLITATNDYEIRAKFRLTELNDSFLYGARQAYGTSSFALHKNYAPFSTDVGTGYVNLGVDSWYTIKQNKNGIYINELLAHAYNNSLASFTTPNTIRVFAMAQGNNALYGSTFMKGDFASFEIYNNGVLVCNLVPCIDSNDVACMYDTVNERFLYNLGTGSFTAGPEVVPSDTVNCTLTGNDIGTLLGYTPVNPSSLSTVATSGSFNDLSDKPTIPTVNNATLTIQKNGTNVQTFTANASSDVTANITVPTATSELNNDSGFITSSSLPTMTYTAATETLTWS